MNHVLGSDNDRFIVPAQPERVEARSKDFHVEKNLERYLVSMGVAVQVGVPLRPFGR